MIIYKNSAEGFQEDVDNNKIVDRIDGQFLKILGHSVSDNEKRSWNNSLNFMEKIVRLSKVPKDCGVLLEYNIPATSKRIDFMITGLDANKKKKLIIVELKQWESAEATNLENLVQTFLGGNPHRYVTHPAYQAFSYKEFLKDMNTAIEENDIEPISCAYLHNYTKRSPEPLLESQYQAICKDTPVFFKDDSKKLEQLFSREVGQGDGLEIADELENGKIRPSKGLIDCIADLYKGNKAFTLLDEQQVAYAAIIDLVQKAKEKTTIIINGGPGTGKSVVAISAFVKLLKLGKDVRFVAPNSAFRTAIIDKLGQSKADKKRRINELFSGSGVFLKAPANAFDALVVDEAHRLKNSQGFMYSGESQIRDIIHASWVNIFFIDNQQKIRPEDEGSVARIKEEAAAAHSTVHEVHLEAQFRCSGAEGYVNWVDNTLQLASTANFDGWDKEAYEFKIVDTPNELENYILEKDEKGFKARMVAGYAWPWTSDKKGNRNAEINDVNLPEYHFARPWNSRSNRVNWAIDPDTIGQIGCVHTSQGLEFDYVGVIIGKDLRYDEATHKVVGDIDHYKDGNGKKGITNNPEQVTAYLKNIYKILLTRGMKGCCVFCYDEALQRYFKDRLAHQNS